MKVITTNLLNRFWKNGVKPIKDSIAGKLDSSKVVNSLLTTVAGYALDARQGKVLDDKINELNSKSKYRPWTFTKVINPNNLPYCTVIFLNDVKNHYNDQTITPHDVCCTICNGDWNSAQIGVRCAVYQNEAYVALLDGTLNIPIRINGTITVNR